MTKNQKNKLFRLNVSAKDRPKKYAKPSSVRRWFCWCFIVTFLVGLGLGCDKNHRRTKGKPELDSAYRSRNTKKILLVHSYHRGYPWVDAVTRGVRMALSKSDVELQLFYMDTKRNTSEAWKRQAGQNAKKAVADWKPDVIIAADDNAQIYFVKDYAGRPSPQFVFCGVNARPEHYGYPASNITGILERPHLKESLEYLVKLKPDIRKLAILTDDSPTSKGALEFLTSPPKPFNVVSIETPSTFEEWKQAVFNVQTSADVLVIYVFHTVKLQPGQESMEPKEVMDWTVKHSTIPILGFFVLAIDDGALCGYSESGVEHGFKAGQTAIEILHGKQAVEIPVVTGVEGQSMLNLNTARKLGISVPEEVVERTNVVVGK